MLKNIQDFGDITTVGNVLFGSYALSSYNEDSEGQRDFYLDERHTKKGDVAYLFEYDTKTFTKLEIVASVHRSSDADTYDNLPEDVLAKGEFLNDADTSAEFITDNDCCLVWFRYGTVCSSGWDLLLSTLSLDEHVVRSETDSIDYYFTGPKELLTLFLPEEYPDACCSELLLELPMSDHSNMKKALVSISPTREIDGGTEDYDWNDVLFPEEICFRLLRFAMFGSEISFQNVETVVDLPFDLTFWCSVRNVPKKFMKEAEEIDKDAYAVERFMVAVSLTPSGFSICCGEPNCMLCYKTSNGLFHWLEYSLSEREQQDVIVSCLLHIGTHLT